MTAKKKTKKKKQWQLLKMLFEFKLGHSFFNGLQFRNKR